MAYVAVRNAEGERGIGSAFHVGDGIFVTARHVVEGKKIDEVRPSEFLRVPLQEEIPEYPQTVIDEITKVVGTPPTWPVSQKPLTIAEGPFFHEDSRADVSVFRTEGVHPKMPFVPLGSHLDDWITGTEWRLSEALILGYPPIPFTTHPELIAVRAEINAVIWIAVQSHACFILSAMPRGGFSGGLALHEGDFALGVVTESLTQGGQPAELGFLSVLSIEPIYECLAQNKLLPESQKEHWEDFWNTDSADFIAEGGLMVASIHVHDDGKRFYFDVMAKEPQIMKAGIDAGLEKLAEATYEEERLREDWVRFHIRVSPREASNLVQAAGRASEEAIRHTGLRAVRALPRKA